MTRNPGRLSKWTFSTLYPSKSLRSKTRASSGVRWVSDLFDSGCEGPSGKEADAMGPSMAAVPWWLVIVLVVVVGVLAVIRQVTRSGKGR